VDAPNITRQNRAQKVANRLTSNYGIPPDEGECKAVADENIEAGQSATFNLPTIGVDNETHDIVGARYQWGESGYLVTMKLDEEPRKLRDVIRSIKGQVKNIGGSLGGVLDLIRALKTFSDTVNISETVDIDERAINDTFILGHPSNSELGVNKGNPLGDRRDNYSDLVTA